MKAKVVLIALFVFSICFGAFSETSSWSQLALLDVHGLWGGKDIWISSDGKAICRFVRPPNSLESGLQEERYSFELSGEQLTELSDCMKKHNLSAAKIGIRAGVPDESSQTIFVKSAEISYAVTKWEKDPNNVFDAIYELLTKLCIEGKKGTLVKKDKVDLDWNPEGFPENQTIRSMARPDHGEK